jgi:hypothetical protein
MGLLPLQELSSGQRGGQYRNPQDPELRLDFLTPLTREPGPVVNIPSPARYAVHKLIVFGERDTASRVKGVNDIGQAAALAQWHLLNGLADRFREAWSDALGRGRGWKGRADEGRQARLARHPDLNDAALWGLK